MGLLDDYSGNGGLAGIGMSPRPTHNHDEFVSAMECYLKIKFFGVYHVFSESAIDYKNLRKSKAPDVNIYNLDYTPKLFIDVTDTKLLNRIIVKCKELIKEKKIQEGFVYDYQKDKWLKFEYGSDNFKISSWSNILNLDITDSFSLVLGYKKFL